MRYRPRDDPGAQDRPQDLLLRPARPREPIPRESRPPASVRFKYCCGCVYRGRCTPVTHNAKQLPPIAAQLWKVRNVPQSYRCTAELQVYRRATGVQRSYMCTAEQRLYSGATVVPRSYRCTAEQRLYSTATGVQHSSGTAVGALPWHHAAHSALTAGSESGAS
jgi:hypothetical protein